MYPYDRQREIAGFPHITALRCADTVIALTCAVIIDEYERIILHSTFKGSLSIVSYSSDVNYRNVPRFICV
jgi:hypothetical protein